MVVRIVCEGWRSCRGGGRAQGVLELTAVNLCQTADKPPPHLTAAAEPSPLRVFVARTHCRSLFLKVSVQALWIARLGIVLFVDRGSALMGDQAVFAVGMVSFPSSPRPAVHAFPISFIIR